MRRSHVVYGSLILVVLSACGAAAPAQTDSATTSDPSIAASPVASASDPSTSSPTAASSDPATSSAAQASTATDADQMIAVFSRSGGIAGRTQTVMVQRDGTIAIRNGDAGAPMIQTAQADPAAIATLEAAINSDAWQQLDAQYGRQVPDGFAYTINAGGKQVQTFDGATNPPILDSVIEQMSALLAAAPAN